MTEYELLQLLEGLGYEPSEENLEILSEDIALFESKKLKRIASEIEKSHESSGNYFGIYNKKQAEARIKNADSREAAAIKKQQEILKNNNVSQERLDAYMSGKHAAIEYSKKKKDHDDIFSFEKDDKLNQKYALAHRHAGVESKMEDIKKSGEDLKKEDTGNHDSKKHNHKRAHIEETKYTYQKLKRKSNNEEQESKTKTKYELTARERLRRHLKPKKSNLDSKELERSWDTGEKISKLRRKEKKTKE